MIRRLLAVASGGGSFAAAPEQQEVTVSAAPQGGWPGRGSAVRVGDYVYVGTANDAGGTRVAIRNLATGANTLRVLTADGTTVVDHHNWPAICVRSDGRLLTAWCDHNGAQMYIRASANTLASDPTISGGWGTQYTIDSQLGSVSYTYPWLADLGGTIVLSWRSISGGSERYSLAFSSDADSATWTTEMLIFSGPNVSARFAKTDDDRIEIVGAPGLSNSSSYHCYYLLSANEFYTSAGVEVPGTPPHPFVSLTRIFNGAVEGMSSSVIDVKSSSGNIAVILNVDDGSDNEYWRSKWDGSWANATITTGAGPNATYYETGFAAVDPNDLDHVIVSRRPTPDLDEPRNIYDYTTDDDFATSTIELISGDGIDDNLYPAFVDGYDSRLEYVWLQGRTGLGEDYDWGIEGWGTD